MQQRKSTLEEYHKQINSIREYINNNLDSPIDLSTLAELSHFSPYHFHRITRALLGEPIGKYITRIRLETAAKLLRYSDLSISEIAYRVGYDAPTSLSKAFKQEFDFSPLEYRNNKNYNMMIKENENLILKIKGPKIMNIPTKQALYISCTGKYGSLDFGGLWQRLWQFVKEQKLFSMGMEHIAIYHDDPKVTDANKLRTDICLTIKKNALPQGEIGIKEIRGGKFAMFLYKGAYNNLEAVYDRIYGELLPEHNLKLRDYHCFEKYLNNPDKTQPDKLKTEIYVPIE